MIKDLFSGFDPDYLLVMDGYDDCIVGVVERFGQEPIVCYDKDKVIQKLQGGGMSRDEAIEFFHFNQFGGVGGRFNPLLFIA